MFAHDENCSGGVLAGIDLQVNGNSTISGGIQSNSNLTVQSNGNPSWGAGSYGPTSNGSCSSTDQYNGHNPWGSPPTQDSVNYPYPLDYSKDFPACGTGSGQTACASNGYPTFCTNEASNITLNGSSNGDTAITDQIYCAAGTGQKNDPSTWNGSISIDLNGSATLYDTFVGGSMTFDGNGSDDVSSCGYAVSGYSASNCGSGVPNPTTANYPIFYATGTSSEAVDIQINGSQTLNGDIFAPNGGASLQMNGNKSLTTFIEANDITGQVNGTFEGDGPAAGTTSTNGGGAVTLVQ
jgi:cytoskeletal protein CcmA (bactofilin family)